MIKRFLLSTTTVAGISSILALAAPAASWAEDAAAPTASGNTVGELVVTGSRIRRTDFNTPSPVQIITADDSEKEGLLNATAILQNSTLAAGSVQLNAQFSGFVVNGGIGIESVSLRGLGAQRTLVLLNGRRLNPAGVSGTVAAVDLNVVPSALVERYEILKDGASSIYGSDAIGGVVNIITKDRFDGITIEADGSFPSRGEGREYNLAINAGRVRDNYHLTGSLQYHEATRLRIGDLPFGDCPPELQALPTSHEYNFGRSYADGRPYCDFPQHDFVQTFNFGIWVRDPNGTPDFPFMPFQQQPFGANPRLTNIETTPDQANVDAESPERIYSATFMGGFDVSPSVEAYFETLLVRRENDVNGYVPQFFPSTVDDILAVSFNPFNPFPDFVQPVITTPIQKFGIEVTAGKAVLGFRGDINFPKSGWKFDVYSTYGRSHGTYETSPRLTSRVFNALDVVPAPAGFASNLVRNNPVDGVNYTCRVNITNQAEGCYPLNWFVSSASFATDPALAYITELDRGKTNYSQLVLSGNIDGPLFDMPAGAVQAVIGGEFRHDRIKDTPGPFAVARDYFGQSTAGITEGSYDVLEGYGELEVPLIKGTRFFESLTANGSLRFTHWETAGSEWTYKVGLNWQVIPELRFRGNYGTSFRGPALYENFLAGQTSFTGAADPCTNYGIFVDPASNLFQNCASEGLPFDWPGYSSTPQVIRRGALGRLNQETSDNLTIGVVWQPTFADLQVTLDYFHIEVNDQIATLGATNLLNLCYESNEFRNGSPYCQLITPRNANGDIDQIDDSYLNVARQITAGFDLSMRYRKEFSFGEFRLDGQATLTTTDKQELLEGSGLEDFNGTFGDPKLVFNGDARFIHKDWTFLWATDFIGPQEIYSQTGAVKGGRYKLHQGAQFYHSASISYEDVGNKWSATVGVRNIFDRFPPFISANPFPAFAPRTSIYANGYGNLHLHGRTFFVNLKKDF